MTYEVNLQRESNGRYAAECPALPGCLSEGKSAEEALYNLKGLIREWLWTDRLMSDTAISVADQPVPIRMTEV